MAKEPEKKEDEDEVKQPDPVVETVSIPKDTLAKILSQLDSYDAALKKNEEQISVLRESVSQGKLLAAEDKRKPDEKPRALLAVFNGKVVTGWKTYVADVISSPLNPDVGVGENLKSIYTYMDGTESGPTDQVLFTRNYNRVMVTIETPKEMLKNPLLRDLKVRFVSLITNDEDLRNTFVMPTEDATVDIRFINP